MGQSRVRGLWVNAGHGTLGWTHGAGSGKALAELISGEQPAMHFGFCNAAPTAATRAPLVSSTSSA
jgi:D-amino-acid dehydrogenase